MINNRSSGSRRSRSRSGSRPQGGGNPQSGNRIDSRARGNAPQLLEKYKGLARDSQMQGDRVMTEYYLQFADHYFRVVSETRQRYEEQRPRRDDYQAQGNDFDDFDEGFEGEPANQERQDERGYQPQGDRGGQDRQREDYRRDGRDDGRRDDNRQQAYQRNDARRDDNRQDYQQRPPRDDNRQDYQQRQPRDDQRNGAAPGNGQPYQRREQTPRRDEPRHERATETPQPQDGMREPAPQATATAEQDEGGRTRRPRSRSTGNGGPNGVEVGDTRIDAAALPPALAPEAPSGDAPKPRRTRAPKRTDAPPAGDQPSGVAA